MDSPDTIVNILACVAAAAFFAAFALTVWPDGIRLVWARIFYAVGMAGCLGPNVYYRLVPGKFLTYSYFPVFVGYLPVLYAGFGVAAIVLLLPVVSRKLAVRCAAVLFFVAAPALILLPMLPYYLIFHRFLPFDLRWLLYAVLWFRIHQSLGRKEAGC
jgi:hypothetical protein